MVHMSHSNDTVDQMPCHLCAKIRQTNYQQLTMFKNRIGSGALLIDDLKKNKRDNDALQKSIEDKSAAVVLLQEALNNSEDRLRLAQADTICIDELKRLRLDKIKFDQQEPLMAQLRSTIREKDAEIDKLKDRYSKVVTTYEKSCEMTKSYQEKAAKSEAKLVAKSREFSELNKRHALAERRAAKLLEYVCTFGMRLKSKAMLSVEEARSLTRFNSAATGTGGPRVSERESSFSEDVEMDSTGLLNEITSMQVAQQQTVAAAAVPDSPKKPRVAHQSKAPRSKKAASPEKKPVKLEKFLPTAQKLPLTRSDSLHMFRSSISSYSVFLEDPLSDMEYSSSDSDSDFGSPAKIEPVPSTSDAEPSNLGSLFRLQPAVERKPVSARLPPPPPPTKKAKPVSKSTHFMKLPATAANNLEDIPTRHAMRPAKPGGGGFHTPKAKAPPASVVASPPASSNTLQFSVRNGHMQAVVDSVAASLVDDEPAGSGRDSSLEDDLQLSSSECGDSPVKILTEHPLAVSGKKKRTSHFADSGSLLTPGITSLPTKTARSMVLNLKETMDLPGIKPGTPTSTSTPLLSPITPSPVKDPPSVVSNGKDKVEFPSIEPATSTEPIASVSLPSLLDVTVVVLPETVRAPSVGLSTSGDNDGGLPVLRPRRPSSRRSRADSLASEQSFHSGSSTSITTRSRKRTENSVQFVRPSTSTTPNEASLPLNGPAEEQSHVSRSNSWTSDRSDNVDVSASKDVRRDEKPVVPTRSLMASHSYDHSEPPFKKRRSAAPEPFRVTRPSTSLLPHSPQPVQMGDLAGLEQTPGATIQTEVSTALPVEAAPYAGKSQPSTSAGAVSSMSNIEAESADSDDDLVIDDPGGVYDLDDTGQLNTSFGSVVSSAGGDVDAPQMETTSLRDIEPSTRVILDAMTVIFSRDLENLNHLLRKMENLPNSSCQLDGDVARLGFSPENEVVRPPPGCPSHPASASKSNLPPTSPVKPSVLLKIGSHLGPTGFLAQRSAPQPVTVRNNLLQVQGFTKEALIVGCVEALEKTKADMISVLHRELTGFISFPFMALNESKLIGLLQLFVENDSQKVFADLLEAFFDALCVKFDALDRSFAQTQDQVTFDCCLIRMITRLGELLQNMTSVQRCLIKCLRIKSSSCVFVCISSICVWPKPFRELISSDEFRLENDLFLTLLCERPDKIRAKYRELMRRQDCLMDVSTPRTIPVIWSDLEPDLQMPGLRLFSVTSSAFCWFSVPVFDSLKSLCFYADPTWLLDEVVGRLVQDLKLEFAEFYKMLTLSDSKMQVIVAKIELVSVACMCVTASESLKQSKFSSGFQSVETGARILKETVSQLMTVFGGLLMKCEPRLPLMIQYAIVNAIFRLAPFYPQKCSDIVENYWILCQGKIHPSLGRKYEMFMKVFKPA